MSTRAQVAVLRCDLNMNANAFIDLFTFVMSKLMSPTYPGTCSGVVFRGIKQNRA